MFNFQPSPTVLCHARTYVVFQIIYVYRDVKDVMVSLYYHYKYHPSKIVDRLGTFVEFAEDFMKGEVADGPYFGHLHSYWTHRHDANVLFIAYEAMLKVINGIRLAFVFVKFLNCDACLIDALCLSYDRITAEQSERLRRSLISLCPRQRSTI